MFSLELVVGSVIWGEVGIHVYFFMCVLCVGLYSGGAVNGRAVYMIDVMYVWLFHLLCVSGCAWCSLGWKWFLGCVVCVCHLCLC